MYASLRTASMPEKRIPIYKESPAHAKRRPVALESPMLAHLFDAMRDLHAWMQSLYVPYVLGGDAAMTLLWRPRVTCELDVLIHAPRGTLKRLVDSAAAQGFYLAPEVEGDERRHGAQVIFEHGPSTVRVSIWAPDTAVQKAAAANPIPVHLEDFVVNLPSPENFLLLSAGWERGPDWEEVANMLHNYPALDRGYLQLQAEMFEQDPALRQGMLRIEKALMEIPPAPRSGTGG